jgi:hypothetical protein
MRVEDVRYLADLVDYKSISIKNTKAKLSKDIKGIWTLYDVLARKRQIRAMKNELIFHFLNIELPSKKPLYILFTDVKWEDFTSQKGIDCRDLENWVNIAMASSARSRWITERIRPLNKMNEGKCSNQWWSEVFLWKELQEVTNG